MSQTTEAGIVRTSVRVDGESASHLTVEQDGPAVLLLHGTYWSRVWLPVLGRLAEAGLRPIAVDLPGLGRSGGELTPETATVPAFADWVERFASALGLSGPIAVAGHDIGGAIAQHLLVHGRLEVSRLALVNSVLYDSWPAPHVARFRGSGTAAGPTADDILPARRLAVTRVLAGAATAQRIADYVEPWTDARVRRSWLALAGAADNRYTRDLVPALQRSTTPKLLIWGEDDLHEKVEYAERFAAEMPETTLIRIPDADHIPTENAPGRIARALIDFCQPCRGTSFAAADAALRGP
ncbi:pimeloyl-ACP methyl ester carboxylesterase [Murinocardiopsis flavida]|uniref:Pimeloyl-ACP methyl ester carboxylesterase n=1 Tax=Murinocardiopsis flavida TaxID=645275 RepID=A0A2P8DQ84_9ACTN|nr:alpha/beta hydrolase [Murinocardiopsis flavida]PSK99385.1 pimeloyl-ACP methyl ester carboxylesterase [Murinocardiopsis flavida]